MAELWRFAVFARDSMYAKRAYARLVTSPATAKSKCKSKSTILKSKSKSTLSGQVQVRVQVLFQKAKSKSKSKSSMEKRTCKHCYSIPVFQCTIPELILKYKR